MKVCHFCKKETNRLAVSKPQTCVICYSRNNKKKNKCKVCQKYYKNVSKKKQICPKCSGYLRPKSICVGCNKENNVVFRDKYNSPFCRVCYKKIFQRKEECDICGKIKIINSKKNNKKVCPTCFNKIKYPIQRRIRDRIRGCFKIYSKTGKIKPIDEYGIDYKAIMEHLGSCPGKLEEHHIDHIKPLCMFDFNDMEQIKLAFAPGNHQWLKAEDNLKKGKKYNDHN